MRRAAFLLFAFALSLSLSDHAAARTPTSQETATGQELAKQRVNENVMFLMGGQPGATFNQLANDISTIVSDGTNLRVISVDGGAAMQNVEDVLF
jgi:hypothetical protein